MTPLIVTIGLIMFMGGIALTAAALRGRMLNAHPHCKGCGFDLIGLDLAEPTTCPECGRTVRSGAGSIRIGKRKRRPVLLAVGVLMLLAGGTGLAWPKLAKIPSIKNFDWYAHFPEALLLRIEAGGDKDALDELHSRLIPGTLSDSGLNQFADHALAMIDADSAPWDERWGDVLLYGFMLDKLTQERMYAVAERSYSYRAFMHEEVSLSAKSVAVWLECQPLERGQWDTNFRMSLARNFKPNETFPELDTPYQAQVRTYPPYYPGLDKPDGGGGISGSHDPSQPGWWIPLQGDGSGIGTSMRLPSDQMEFQARFDVEVTLWKGDRVFHTWSQTFIKTGKRVEQPLYLELRGRSPAVDRVIGEIECSPFEVPTRINEALQHDEISQRLSPVMTIGSKTDSTLGLLGTLWISDGDMEIELGAVQIPDLSKVGYSVTPPHDWSPDGKNWLEWFAEHQEFWDRAVERGSIDVIYRPDQSLAASDPRIERMIDAPIIFKDVALVIDVPKLKQIHQGPNGPIVNEWRMSRVREPEAGVGYTTQEYQFLFAYPDPVQGKPLDE